MSRFFNPLVFVLFCVPLLVNYFLMNRYLRSQRLKSPEVVVRGYDTLIKGIDAKRLGFSVHPDFSLKPKTWREVLNNIKTELDDKTNKSRGAVLTKKRLKSKSVEQSLEIQQKQPRPKEILIFDDAMESFYPYPRKQQKKPYEFECNYSRWTYMKRRNKSLKFQDFYNNYDAIIKYRDYAHQQVIKVNSKLGGPTVIYFGMEPPSRNNSFVMENFEHGPRHVLASFWRGSDIYTPYIRWNYDNWRTTAKRQDKNYAEGRTKMAAIVVSNCNPENNRLGLVKELQKYISVDIFGKCGNNSCFKKRDSKCFLQLKKDYKFYLAFESTNCRDYITEKLGINSFKYDLLPIVFGAHPTDYKVIAPKNSYIHIEDFESIKKLGEYIQLLDRNDTLYNEYFAWKGTGYIKYFDFFREFCAYLHVQELSQSPGFDMRRFVMTRNGTRVIPYFNTMDSYHFETFDFNSKNQKLCLGRNQWYWNKPN